MDLQHTPHIAKLALGCAGLLFLYGLILRITTARRRAAFARQKGCLPAPRYPQSERIFGYSFFKKNMAAVKAHKFLEHHVQRFKEMGTGTVNFVALGNEIHQTIEPENLKTIQAIDAKKWSLGTRRKSSFGRLLGVGIFTTDGAEWAHSRAMLRPSFTRSQVGDLVTFEKHIQNLIASVPKDGSTVDLSDYFFRLTMDSATEFLFGESTESLTRSSTDGFAGAFNRSQDFVANNSRWGWWARFFPANTQFETDRKFIFDFVDYYVERGLSKRAQLLRDEKSGAGADAKPGRYIFIDELVRQTTDRTRIRSELLNILLAGRDTTASLLTNVFFILGKRPDIWAKLQAEIATLDSDEPSFEQLKELKYLKAILNESLRLHPVVPANSREAMEDTTLPLGGGPDGSAPLFIKKGQVVVWSVYTMHRRKDFYGDDADEFKPERWLDDPQTGRKGLRPGWEYLPFNGGMRICLGQQFALTEASYTTVRLCQAFSGIESRDPGPWQESLTLTCVNLNGANVALTPRDS